MNMNIHLFQLIHAGAGNHPLVDSVAIFFAEGGPYLLALLFVVLWFFVGNHKKTILVEATEAAIIGLIVNQLIGFFYFHPRPYMLGICTPLFPHRPETSFPSDHATLLFAATCYLLISRRWPVCAISLLAVTLLTAWGRVYCGIHFPFDMVGSLVVGLASAGVTSRFSSHLRPLNAALLQICNQLKGMLTSR